MSSFLELTAELERDKVKRLMCDVPKKFNKFIGRFSLDSMNFLIDQGFLPSATVWGKIY